ncbi:NUDIX hydrolase [Catenulispora acidiphila DSM 44928]|uniref:NUDIX hydrolase n=1 Tax=Catenulispora acidiphila (strain DSM 44928 / JCM 14897 / NBRC 102108 / NRRL B-24433 / ID139908) TaxID=479433 RepID=C7Q2I6_CATAD|nr:NUDIX hydrolase [Catenulispora acidiphila]ACU69828.1 NUDIX hydrolase [Catenulispora acidiphila DSM 44928]
MSDPEPTPSHATPEATSGDTLRDLPHPVRSRSQWTVHGERPVYENPWIDVLLAEVELADGTRFEHHVVRTRSAAGCVVTRTEAGREEVLLIWRHRFAIDKWVWEIPSGLIEEGEDPAEAARREVEEETGWRVSDVTPLLTFHPVGGMLRTQYRLFRAIGAEHIGEPTEQNEAEKVAWIPLDEVLGLIDAGQIATSSSLVGLLRVLTRS